MCNGLPLSVSEAQGRRFYHAIDGDAAALIAADVSKASVPGAPVCPFIRQCHKDCMLIMNRHQGRFPTDASAQAGESDPRECEVDIVCQDPELFVSATLTVAPELLERDA